MEIQGIFYVNKIMKVSRNNHSKNKRIQSPEKFFQGLTLGETSSKDILKGEIITTKRVEAFLILDDT